METARFLKNEVIDQRMTFGVPELISQEEGVRESNLSSHSSFSNIVSQQEQRYQAKTPSSKEPSKKHPKMLEKALQKHFNSKPHLTSKQNSTNHNPKTKAKDKENFPAPCPSGPNPAEAPQKSSRQKKDVDRIWKMSKPAAKVCSLNKKYTMENVAQKRSQISSQLSTFPHSPMINRKSVKILEKKFKKEREEKFKKEKQSRQLYGKSKKHNFKDYQSILNRDLPNSIKSSPRREQQLLDNLQSLGKNNKSRNNKNGMQTAKTQQPKAYGRKKNIQHKTVREQITGSFNYGSRNSRAKKESKNIEKPKHNFKNNKKVEDLYKWKERKEKKIQKLQRKESKHLFKPDINPVSRIIIERRESMYNQSGSSFSSESSQMSSLPIHEKLYLSRNNSTDQLNRKGLGKGLESRSYSVCEFKNYKSPMPKITEERKRLPPTGKILNNSKSKRNFYMSKSPRLSIDRNQELYEMRKKKEEYRRVLMEEHMLKQEEKILKECTFKPKINPSTRVSLYTYQVSTEEGTVELEADVIKRNQFWEKTRQKRINQMKKEKENQIKEECTFTPKVSREKSKSLSRSPIASQDPTPTNLNHKAFDKFINRQELARCIQKEKDIYKEKLESGSRINHRCMKDIDDHRNALLREISLPTNEDFSNYTTLNSNSNRSVKKPKFREEDEKNLQDLDLAIDEAFIHKPDEMLRSSKEENDDLEREDSLDIIQEQLFEETGDTALRNLRSWESETSENIPDDSSLPNNIDVDTKPHSYAQRRLKNKLGKAVDCSNDQFQEAKLGLRDLLYSFDI
ncbi:unnamed protein product [Moneuplotes crassus]|uniref:Uncharacterized protein n=1 Tax=Euplotes crassus TaxID=5936 RepID=A0AAD1Y3J9_EUPCR|nr:unnamed protein product [Moneuplotes crassus]